MLQSRKKFLLLCYGNPGRLDDGLGPALGERIETSGLPGVTVDINYQPAVESAPDIAESGVVIFADASVSGAEPFEFRKLKPEFSTSFTSHHLPPAVLLYLAVSKFGAEADAYMLAIRGYEFDGFGERLSEKAKENLEASVDFLLDFLKDKG